MYTMSGIIGRGKVSLAYNQEETPITVIEASGKSGTTIIRKNFSGQVNNKKTSTADEWVIRTMRLDEVNGCYDILSWDVDGFVKGVASCLWYIGAKECVKITTENGHKLVCAGNKEVLAVYRDGKAEWVEAGKLKAGYYVWTIYGNIKIKSVEPYPERCDVFDLETKFYDSYVVNGFIVRSMGVNCGNKNTLQF